MPVQSKNSNPDDLQPVTESESESEPTVTVTTSISKKPHKFGDCMWNRHEYCKVELENGIRCTCDCGDGHGSKYVAQNLDTPLNRIFQKIVEYNKRGEMYSESEEFLAGVEASAVVLKTTSTEYQRESAPNVEESDTLAELEEKRK